jgi:excisionase family DNA binding protein
MCTHRETMTVDEASRVLGLSRGTAYKLAPSGKLPCLRVVS